MEGKKSINNIHEMSFIDSVDSLDRVCDKLSVVIQSVTDPEYVKYDFFEGLFFLLNDIQKELRQISADIMKSKGGK